VTSVTLKGQAASSFGVPQYSSCHEMSWRMEIFSCGKVAVLRGHYKRDTLCYSLTGRIVEKNIVG